MPVLRKTRTADDEQAAIERYILPLTWLARLRLEDIQRRHARQCADELALVRKVDGSPPAPKTIANIHASVGTMLERAAFEELIPHNPWKVERGLLQRRSTKTRAPYRPEDVATLITSDRLGFERRVWNALAFFTGGREGEVCGFRFRDWDRDTVPLGCLSCTTQYDGRPLKTERRGGEHPRKIPVHPELARVLAAWWAEGFELVFARKPTLDDFIVPQRSGECHTRSSAYKAFRRDQAAVAVDNRSLHSTRHTFITLCRRGGADRGWLERVTHNAQGGA